MGLDKLRAAIEAKGAKKTPGPGVSRARNGNPVISAPAVKTQSEQKLDSVMKQEPAVRRVIKGAAKLADRITEDDRDAAHQAIRRALHASNTMFDHKARQLVKIPDHKTQLAAATLLLAYDEGTPVKRIAAIVENRSTAADRLNALRESPEMAKTIRALCGLGVKVEDDGEVIDVEAEDVQETGSDSDGVAS